jgi:hypothetical protein
VFGGILIDSKYWWICVNLCLQVYKKLCCMDIVKDVKSRGCESRSQR